MRQDGATLGVAACARAAALTSDPVAIHDAAWLTAANMTERVAILKGKKQTKGGSQRLSTNKSFHAHNTASAAMFTDVFSATQRFSAHFDTHMRFAPRTAHLSTLMLLARELDATFDIASHIQL